MFNCCSLIPGFRFCCFSLTSGMLVTFPMHTTTHSIILRNLTYTRPGIALSIIIMSPIYRMSLLLAYSGSCSCMPSVGRIGLSERLRSTCLLLLYHGKLHHSPRRKIAEHYYTNDALQWLIFGISLSEFGPLTQQVWQCTEISPLLAFAFVKGSKISTDNAPPPFPLHGIKPQRFQNVENHKQITPTKYVFLF